MKKRTVYTVAYAVLTIVAIINTLYLSYIRDYGHASLACFAILIPALLFFRSIDTPSRKWYDDVHNMD